MDADESPSPANPPNPGIEAALHTARADVLRDLTSRDIADAAVVSMLEDAVSQRRWWAEQWPAGTEFLLGLVAQDIQDALLEAYGRWPLCGSCAVEGELQPLSVEPELGPDPHWVCEKEGIVIAAVGALGA